MLNAVAEMFLSEYFFMDFVVGRFISDKKSLFTCLSRIYLLSKSETDLLYNLTERLPVFQICSENDFLMYQRMQKYFAINGLNNDVDTNTKEIINIKGGAIGLAVTQKLQISSSASRNSVFNNLFEAAKSGNICAMRTMGILKCEGIFLEKDSSYGIKLLKRTANWNDIGGTLALLYYDKGERIPNASRLQAEVENTPFASLADKAKHKYAVTKFIEIPEMKILNRAFNSATVNRQKYHALCARILNSDILTLKDKANAILSLDKIAVFENLPLKFTNKITDMKCEFDCNGVLREREQEKRQLQRAVRNMDLRSNDDYRPLCLVCDSKYILNTYEKALRNDFVDRNVDFIDVSALTEYDLEPTANNIFVRSINEMYENIYLLRFTGDCSERKMEYVKNFLLSSKRGKFHLNTPNVTLNLKAVLPICFCDRKNAKALSDYCDMIYLAEVSDNEMMFAIQDIIDKNKRIFNVDVLLPIEGIKDICHGCDIDLIEYFVDTVAMLNREVNKTIELSREEFEAFAQSIRRNKIGFGGIINGNK